MVGDERYTIRVLDLATREHRPDEIVGVIGGATWDPSGEHLYYTTVDDSWRSDKIWRHTLGTAQADDELVHHEQDGRFFVGVGRSRSDRFVIIAAGSKITSEYRFLDSQDPERRLPGLQRAARGAGVLPRPRGHRRRGRLPRPAQPRRARTSSSAPRRSRRPPPRSWAPLVAHDPAVRLEDVDAFAGHLVVHQRSEGLTQLRILELGDAGVRRRLPGRVRPRGLHGRLRRQPELRPAHGPARLHDDGGAVVGLRLRRPHPRADAAAPGAGARRLRARRLRGAPALGDRRGRRAGPDLDRVPARGPRRRTGPDPALRLRRLRDVDRPVLLGGPALAARPRRGVRDRPRARRRRDGPPLVRRRQAAAPSSTPSPTSSPAAGTSSRPAGRRRRRWSPRAPAPAGC